MTKMSFVEGKGLGRKSQDILLSIDCSWVTKVTRVDVKSLSKHYFFSVFVSNCIVSWLKPYFLVV